MTRTTLPAIALGVSAAVLMPLPVTAQVPNQLTVWQPKKGAAASMLWSQDGHDELSSKTLRTRYVRQGDSVCVVVPNAHPIFYSYSIAAETLKVKTELPAAPLLLALAKASGQGAPMVLPEEESNVWFIKYGNRLDGLAVALQRAREVAKWSDASDGESLGKSNFQAAVDSIAILFNRVPRMNAGETIEKAAARWAQDAEKDAAKAAASVPSPPPKASLPAAKTPAEATIVTEADKQYRDLEQHAAAVRDKLSEALEGGGPTLLTALKTYGEALLAQQQAFAKTWNGVGAPFRACQTIGTETIRLKLSAAIKDSAMAKDRHTGTIGNIILVPKYHEEIVTVTPMFSLSLTGYGEPEYKVRNGVIVDDGDSKFLYPRPAALLSFRLWQMGDAAEFVWRLGVGSNVVSDNDNLERLFAAFTVNYRNVLGVGIGAGRVRRQRLSDLTLLGKPLPSGKQLSDLLLEPDNRPAFYVLLNFSNVNALGALSNLVSKTKP